MNLDETKKKGQFALHAPPESKFNARDERKNVRATVLLVVSILRWREYHLS